MAQEEQLPPELARQIEILESMSEEERAEYVVGVFRAVAEGLKKVLSKKSAIAKIRAGKKLIKELESKWPQILVAFLWTIKPEYRELWIALVQTALEAIK